MQVELINEVYMYKKLWTQCVKKWKKIIGRKTFANVARNENEGNQHNSVRPQYKFVAPISFFWKQKCVLLSVDT